jgi:hypothetical protein
MLTMAAEEPGVGFAPTDWNEEVAQRTIDGLAVLEVRHASNCWSTTGPGRSR